MSVADPEGGATGTRMHVSKNKNTLFGPNYALECIYKALNFLREHDHRPL